MNGCALGSALWVGKLKHREPGRRDFSLLCTPIVLQEHPINPQGDAPRPAAGRGAEPAAPQPGDGARFGHPGAGSVTQSTP